MDQLIEAGFTEEQARAVMGKVNRQRRIDLVLMAAGLVLLIGAVFLVTTLFTDRVNEAAIKNCEDTNRTTEGLARSLDRGIETAQAQIVETKTTDYSTLFPSLPPEQLQLLLDRQIDQLHEQNEQRRHDKAELVIVDCAARFP